MHRTGRLLAASMPVSNSAFPARPPQPSAAVVAHAAQDVGKPPVPPPGRIALVVHHHLAAGSGSGSAP
jgi:hypothetical protein